MFPENCGSVPQRSSSELMTSSNSQGIKYSASNIRTDQNLCVIRDNGGKMAKRKVFRKKKRKKKEKLKKQWKLER